MNNLSRSAEICAGAKKVEDQIINHSILSDAVNDAFVKTFAVEIANYWERQI
jgi:hypothetical protein